VQLIYDIAHASVLSANPLATFEQRYARIALFQIVDVPGRVEPDAGTSGFPFEAVLASAIRRGFGGLVDLEFAWSDRSEAGELRELDRLRQLDAAARAAHFP
jgi:hydroxypyruvate isomerase